jgi:hypothetical protein
MLKKISFYFTTLFLAFSLIGSAYAVTLKKSPMARNTKSRWFI